jgi:pectate lyase C
MTKLSNGRWANACALALVAACGAETGSSPSATGEAGASGTQPSAGMIAGTTAVAGGRGGMTASAGSGANAAAAGSRATATGTAGASGTAGRAGATAMNAAAGAAAMSGTSGGSAAGDGASGTGAAGAAGRGEATAAGSGGDGGSQAAPPKDGGRLDETFIVKAGETFDGKGQRYSAGPALGDGSQDEDQKPLFQLQPGATLENVVLGSPAADGIHCLGDATLRNIVWEDIGEDAMTIKGKGTVKLDGGSAKNGDDKVFQINAESRFEVSNFTASNAGKFIRQNGGTDFKVEVVIDSCDISNMDEAIFRTDSDSSSVEMKNTRYSKIGDELFIGVSAGNIKQQNNTEY